jgi:cysteine desulfurase / selenocysteine lyase
MDWTKIRQDFPVADNITYFLSAGMSPVPNAVLRKLMEEYRKLNQFGDAFFQKDLGEVAEYKKQLAGLINAGAEDISFTGNNSLAMSVVALSLKNKFTRPFNIVSLEEEFPSDSVPYEYQGIHMKYVQPENHRYPVESILSLIDENTKAVVASYVQYATGFRLDVQRLGTELKKRGVLFIVNATQAFPFYPVDVKSMNLDVLTCSMHKWGFTGHIGTLFYTSVSFRKTFPSPFAGWLSVQPRENEWFYTAKNKEFKLYDSADRYTFGTYNLQGFLASRVAFDYLLDIGFENIRTRISELGDYLIAKLKALPLYIITPIKNAGERSAIISFRMDEIPPEECLAFLEHKGVYVSLRLGFIRVSLNIFNNETDIDRLCEALDIFFKTRENI